MGFSVKHRELAINCPENVFDLVQKVNRCKTNIHAKTIVQTCTELSTGRMDPRVGSGRVESGRVGSRFCRILAGRVGSGQHFGF